MYIHIQIDTWMDGYIYIEREREIAKKILHFFSVHSPLGFISERLAQGPDV